MMKIMSLNVHGIGGWEKRREVIKVKIEKRPWIFCIQVTKLEVVDEVVCRFLWGTEEVGFLFSPFVGASVVY